MKKLKCVILICQFLLLSGFIREVKADTITSLPANTFHRPGNDWITGHFTDFSGNHLFMVSNGALMDRGKAAVIKMNAFGTDTLVRNFSVTDTLSALFTGFQTDHNTYIFIGQLKQDTISSLCKYCYLWIVETDTLLQTVSTKRYDIPHGYSSFSDMKGYQLSAGSFILLGLMLAPAATWYDSDLILMRFNDLGDTVRTIKIVDPLNEGLYFSIMNPGDTSFSAIITGLNIHVEYERMVIDTGMNYQHIPFMEDLALQRPISFLWMGDTSLMIACSQLLPTDVQFDIRLLTAGLSGVSMQNLVLGTYNEFDCPAFVNALVPAGNQEYYVGGVYNINNYFNPDTMILLKVDENLNILGSLHYYCPVNYVLHSLYPEPDGKILVAAIINDSLLPVNARDITFFTIDPGFITGLPQGNNQNTGMDFLLSPNPGVNELNITPEREGPFSVKIYDLTGKRIQEASSSGKSLKIEGNMFQSGMYLVEIKDVNNNVIIKKWIKNN